VRLVVGSCVQLAAATLRELDVEVVEYPLFVNGEPFPASLDMSAAERDRLRSLMLDKHNRIETAGLRESDLLAAYRRVGGEPILSFHQAEAFTSSTYRALERVAADHPELDVTCVDSGHTCAGYSVQVLRLARALRERIARSELLPLLDRLRRNTVDVGATRDLFYLARTGRIGAGRALLGTALGLLPLLIVRGDQAMARPFGRVRTPDQANQRMVDALRADIERLDCDRVEIVITWFGGQERWADRLAEDIARAGWRTSIHREPGQHSASAHLGPDYWEMGYTVDAP
jgi:DegV family protein with EDD domain